MSDEVEQDAAWPERAAARMRAALEVLATSEHPMSMIALREAAAERVPLLAYDAEANASGGVRAWNKLGWNVSSCGTIGWVHTASPGGLRLTTSGRAALESNPTPSALVDEREAVYAAWWNRRKEILAPHPTASDEILHGGSPPIHVARACAPVLEAWRSADSALAPDTPVWTAGTAAALLAHLDADDGRSPATLPGLADDHARILAAEMNVLLTAPFSDLKGHVKRERVRSSLVPPVDPPGLPWEISGDLEVGFVPGSSPPRPPRYVISPGRSATG